MRPPDTKVDAVVEHRHGVDIPDPYRWLEGDNTDPARMGRVTPEVAAWTDAQNAHTRAVLDRKPWSGEFDPLTGVVLHEQAVTMAMAAE